ncbi:hypothetical protein LZ30DRAFT_705152 [Colletotrichum cereale]|nr:hypothetical protein LZ30DRAFT_705152 [Colletotrichum cereale]
MSSPRCVVLCCTACSVLCAELPTHTHTHTHTFNMPRQMTFTSVIWQSGWPECPPRGLKLDSPFLCCSNLLDWRGDCYNLSSLGLVTMT